MPIQLEHVSYTYGQGTSQAYCALRDVNLQVQKGELIGLLGHTGSGKTTLVQHLNGLLKPTNGNVIVDGLSLTDKATPMAEVRKKIGLVFQYPEYQLFEETVAKDVAFGPKNLGVSGEALANCVREAILRVGLNYDDVAERSPFELSGGQMRRVAIAGVLAMHPEYLVLDEPAAGLDPAGRNSLLSLIASLHRETGMTIIMVSHSMDDIAGLATRLVVLSKGEVVLDGTPGHVFSQSEQMNAIGLGVPQAAQLANELRSRGYAIPEGIYTIHDVKDAILSIGRKGERKC